MGGGPERTRVYRHHHLDSTRWDGFRPRPDDIIITTAYKAGTTWMQRIVSLLVLGPQPLPARLGELSPWVDARFRGPVEPILQSLEAQRHRRFIKSHLAADGLPFWEDVRYIVVGRDTRDVFMSLWNHYTGHTEFMYALLNDAGRPGPEFPRPPETPSALWRRWIREGWFDWEPDGWPYWSHHHHVATWWAHRELPNLLLVHYSDLLADLDTEMRRVATFLDIEVDDEVWPELVAAARFDAMKDEARRLDEADPTGGSRMVWHEGADTFFYKGTNGRWRSALTEDDLALYDDAAAALDPELRIWLERGRHAAH
jgi:aryl sulfotransferase